MFVFYFVSLKNYKKRYKMDYRIRNYFPYELNYRMLFKDNMMGNIMLILASILYLACYIIALFNRMTDFYYAIFAVGTIATFIPIALIFTPLERTRQHMLFVTLSFAFSFLNVGLIAVESYRIFNSGINFALGLTSFIISIIIGLFIFVLILNPKLSSWGKMDQVTNDDGTISYARPKFFVLAFSEWMIIIANLLTLIPLFILIISFH